MEYYQNFEGNSGVAAFASNGDSITIQFKSGDIYRYTIASTGEAHIREMKKLAREGKGLSSYISKHVKDAYAAKLSG